MLACTDALATRAFTTLESMLLPSAAGKFEKLTEEEAVNSASKTNLHLLSLAERLHDTGKANASHARNGICRSQWVAAELIMHYVLSQGGGAANISSEPMRRSDLKELLPDSQVRRLTSHLSHGARLCV